jgi:hypothetical protein
MTYKGISMIPYHVYVAGASFLHMKMSDSISLPGFVDRSVQKSASSVASHWFLQTPQLDAMNNASGNAKRLQESAGFPYAGLLYYHQKNIQARESKNRV